MFEARGAFRTNGGAEYLNLKVEKPPIISFYTSSAAG